MTYDFRFQLTSEWNFHYWRFNVKLFFCCTNQPGVYLYWIEKLQRNKEVLFPFHQNTKTRKTRINNNWWNNLKEMQQFIHVWYLNCFLNRKWTCFIVCESYVFCVLSSGSYSGIRWGYRNLQECCTLLKSWLKWQKLGRMDCHAHSKLSGVSLDTLGREDWGNALLGDSNGTKSLCPAVHV